MCAHPRTPPRLQACARWDPSAGNVGPSFRSNFGPTRPSSAEPSLHDHPGCPEPHPPLRPAKTAKDGCPKDGCRRSGTGSLGSPGGPSLANCRWQGLGNPQGVFVPVLSRGAGLCPLWFGPIHCPPPHPQPGQRRGTVLAIRAMSKPQPLLRLSVSSPHSCTIPSARRADGQGLRATLSPSPPSDFKLSSHPQHFPFLLFLLLPCAHSPQLPLSPSSSSNAKLVCTSGPSPMLFPLPEMLLPLDFSPGLSLLFQI